MALPPLPPTPPGVQYALTVPQSVLFADISLRGSRRARFREAFGTDFSLDWVAIDDGAMSWDFSTPADLERLIGTPDLTSGLRRFVSVMGRTGRAVEKVSAILVPPASRRPGDREDILADLREYWDAYELHMTSLFTFWNVEQAASSHVVEQLRGAGLASEIENGLQRFLRPIESNYFSIERRQFARIAARYAEMADQDGALNAALEQHISTFGFLLAPFNLGAPPSPSSLRERFEDADHNVSDPPKSMVESAPDFMPDFPDAIQELGLLMQELTFWKTERLDIMALADARVAGLYGEAAAALDLDRPDMFAMTRDELDASLMGGACTVAIETLRERRAGFCLLLDHEEIAFYEPSTPAAEIDGDHTAELVDGKLHGISASVGRATGNVRVILDLSAIGSVEAGDILVTTMTRPEMGVALDRAAAFVTDQGGTMSHAAIIAREMQKPCVIGTEVGTKVLRNGMRVTVDGDEGCVIVTTPPADDAGPTPDA